MSHPEWKVERLSWVQIERKLNELSAEGFDIVRLEPMDQYKNEWFIIACKPTSTPETIPEMVGSREMLDAALNILSKKA